MFENDLLSLSAFNSSQGTFNRIFNLMIYLQIMRNCKWEENINIFINFHKSFWLFCAFQLTLNQTGGGLLWLNKKIKNSSIQQQQQKHKIYTKTAIGWQYYIYKITTLVGPQTMPLSLLAELWENVCSLEELVFVW